MEEKIIKTNSVNEQHLLQTYSIFEYRCVERTVKGKQIILKFVRDDSVPYFSELKKLEYQYGSYHIGSMLPTLLLPAISFILLTVFLVLMFTLKENFNLLLYFLTLIIPGLICLVLGVILMMLRVRMMGKIANEKNDRDREYAEKVRKLKANK